MENLQARKAILTQKPTPRLITFLPCKHWTFEYVARNEIMWNERFANRENRRLCGLVCGRTHSSVPRLRCIGPQVFLCILQQRELIHLLAAGDPLVNRLASGEPLAGAVPMGNRFFTQLPAQQDNLT